MTNSEATQTNKTATKKNTLGKVQTSSTEDTADRSENEKVKKINPNEDNLLNAVRFLAQHHGTRKSGAAVRDAVERPHELFGATEAVSALSNLGFKSSFGQLKFSNITQDLLPFLAFKKDGEVVIFVNINEDQEITARAPGQKTQTITLKKNDYAKEYSGYTILAKKLSSREEEERTGHWFFSAFRKSKWTYTQVMIAAMVSNFLSLSTALFTMTVYDRVIPNGAFESLIALSIGVAIALAFDFVIKSLRARFIDEASKKADLEISRRLFNRILTLTPSDQRQRTGAMANTVREFETLREFFNSTSLVVLIDLPFVFFFIYVIYLIAGPVAYVLMAAVPLVIIVGLGIQPFLARITRGSIKSSMNKQAVLVETLNGLETVNATGSGKLMRKRYEDALNNQADSGNKIRTLSMFIVNFAASVQQYTQVCAIFVGVYLIVEGTITQGALIGAVILGGRTMSPLSQLANTLSRMNSALAAYRNLGMLIGQKRDSILNSSPISRPKLEGEIEFKNVSFSFSKDAPPVLDNLTFKIPRGQKVALVGKMGSGKSTLARLVAGTLEPTEGAILIDGVDVRQIDPSDVRKNIGSMLQETWLFSGSIRENIQMGYNEYDDEHILKICKIAGVDSFVGSTPKGYDLELREKGAGLSGGQKQTINLARSLLHDPQILLLDEPTSSMDQGTEKMVVESLTSVTSEKTMLIITHRNPILVMVDRVFVLESGKIVADQTPEQLGIKKG